MCPFVRFVSVRLSSPAVEQTSLCLCSCQTSENKTPPGWRTPDLGKQKLICVTIIYFIFVHYSRVGTQGIVFSLCVYERDFCSQWVEDPERCESENISLKVIEEQSEADEDQILLSHHMTS